MRHAPSAGASRLLGVKVLAALAMALGWLRRCRDRQEHDGRPPPLATSMILAVIRLEAVVVTLLAVLVVLVVVVVVVVVVVLGRRSTPPSWRHLLRLRRLF